MGGDALGAADLRRVTGRVVAVRQGVVAPKNDDFGVEDAFVIDDGDGRVSVGGEGRFWRTTRRTACLADRSNR